MATFEQIASGYDPTSWMPASNGGAWDGSALAEPDPGTLVGAETWPIDDTYDPASWEYGPAIPEGWPAAADVALSDPAVLGGDTGEFGQLEYEAPAMPKRSGSCGCGGSCNGNCGGGEACCGSCASGGACEGSLGGTWDQEAISTQGELSPRPQPVPSGNCDCCENLEEGGVYDPMPDLGNGRGGGGGGGGGGGVWYPFERGYPVPSKPCYAACEKSRKALCTPTQWKVNPALCKNAVWSYVNCCLDQAVAGGGLSSPDKGGGWPGAPVPPSGDAADLQPCRYGKATIKCEWLHLGGTDSPQGFGDAFALCLCCKCTWKLNEVCENAGDSKGAKCVRGCLQTFRVLGATALGVSAHETCKSKCRKAGKWTPIDDAQLSLVIDKHVKCNYPECKSDIANGSYFDMLMKNVGGPALGQEMAKSCCKYYPNG